MAAANKRIGNILKKAGDDVPATVDPTLLTEPAEAALAEAVEPVYAATGRALAHGDYVDALPHLARLRPRAGAVSDQVMVNVDVPPPRPNPLALQPRLSVRTGPLAGLHHLPRRAPPH